MGILVTLAIIWLAAILAVIVFFSIGPPARGFLGLRAEVVETAEEMRQKANLNREQVLRDLQVLDWPVDTTIGKYQDSRRQILPGATSHRWAENELSSWMQREILDRGRSLRQRNLFSLLAWNLTITVVLGSVGWVYYQHVQSKSRPQLSIPSSSYPTQP